MSTALDAPTMPSSGWIASAGSEETMRSSSSGSALISAAALHWRRASTSWQLELLALPILTAGWILYTVSLILADPDPAFDWPVSPVMLGFSFIAACLLRLVEVLYVVQRTRRNVDALPEELRP